MFREYFKYMGRGGFSGFSLEDIQRKKGLKVVISSGVGAQNMNKKNIHLVKNSFHDLDSKEKKLKLNISDSNESESQKPVKRNKYRNTKVVYNGITFDSTKECEYYKTLEFKKKNNLIADFKHQFILGFFIEEKRIFKLILDFVITENNGNLLYHDVKPLDKKTGKYLSTPDFKLKRKFIEAQHKIKIELV